jgi:5-methylcytosine-specific restriction endonuclease McrA
VAACSACNLKKADRLPAEAHLFPATPPYAPSVNDLHQNGRLFPPNYLHESWMDYLYWDSVLEP